MNLKTILLILFIISCSLFLMAFVSGVYLTSWAIHTITGILVLVFGTYWQAAFGAAGRPVVAHPAEDLIIHNIESIPFPGSRVVCYTRLSTITVVHESIDNWGLFCETKGIIKWHYFDEVPGV